MQGDGGGQGGEGAAARAEKSGAHACLHRCGHMMPARHPCAVTRVPVAMPGPEIVRFEPMLPIGPLTMIVELPAP